MGHVLTHAAMIMCSHGGMVQPIPTQQKLTVDNQPVLVDGDLVNAPVTGCTNPPASGGPCLTTTAMSLGAATKLSVGNKAVLLDNAMGQTNIATWNVASAGQIKLTAI
jgi:hypothetical protein